MNKIVWEQFFSKNLHINKAALEYYSHNAVMIKKNATVSPYYSVVCTEGLDINMIDSQRRKVF